jgi:hypothetical protein
MTGGFYILIGVVRAFLSAESQDERDRVGEFLGMAGVSSSSVGVDARTVARRLERSKNTSRPED